MYTGLKKPMRQDRHGSTNECRIDQSVARESSSEMPHHGAQEEEPRHRQRQEARTQREKYRPSNTKTLSGREAMFKLVRKPRSDTKDNLIQKVLGPFDRFAALMSVDQQPVTPATTIQQSDVAIENTNNFPSQHQNSAEVKQMTRPSYQSAHWVSSSKDSTTPKSNDRQHMSSGSKSSIVNNHTKHNGDSNMVAKSSSQNADHINLCNPPTGRSSRNSSNQLCSNKDPLISRIINEMSDLKSPLSGLHQTPRPDHQSLFTFPPTSTQAKAPAMPASHLKSGKTPDKLWRQPKDVIKPLDEVQLSEESDDEHNSGVSDCMVNKVTAVGNGPTTSHSVYSPSLGEGTRLPLSPLGSDSSNSDDSSASDTEEESSSNSSEEEESKTGRGSSPLHPSSPVSAPPSWNLEEIFKQQNGSASKDDSAQEVCNKATLDNTEPAYDLNCNSPYTTKLAPPVITTEPNTGSQIQLSTLSNDSSSDERSHSNVMKTPVKLARIKLADRQSYAPSALSSDSDEEKPERPCKKSKYSLLNKSTPGSQSGKSVVNKVPKFDHTDKPISKKSQKRQIGKEDKVRGRRSGVHERKEIKSVSLIPSDQDSSSDESIDVINCSPEKHNKKSSLNSSVGVPEFIAGKESFLTLSPAANNPSNSKKNILKLNNIVNSPTAKTLPYKSHHAIEDDKHGKVKTQLENGTHILSKSLQNMDKQNDNRSSPDKKSSRRSRHHCSEESNPTLLNECNSKTDVARTPMPLDCRLLDPLSASTLPTLCPSNSSVNITTCSLNNVKYENGLPKIVCSVAVSVIDRLPNGVNIEQHVKDVKIFKEQMRTSPSNEDSKKIRAIFSIYKGSKKRQNSQEPEKCKKDSRTDHPDSDTGEKVKPEAVQIKPNSRRGESKSQWVSNPSYESSRQRHESASSLSSNGNAKLQESKDIKKEKAENKSSESEIFVKDIGRAKKRKHHSPEHEGGSRKKSKESTETGHSTKASMKRDVRGESVPKDTSDDSCVSKKRGSHIDKPFPDNSYIPELSSSQQPSQNLLEVVSPNVDQASDEDSCFTTPQQTNTEKNKFEDSSQSSQQYPGCFQEHNEQSVTQNRDVSDNSATRIMYPAVVGETHSQETLAESLPHPVTQVPHTHSYLSMFEKKVPDIQKDHMPYLMKAKELKHSADKESNRSMQIIIYLEAGLYFIITGESMDCEQTQSSDAFSMYNDTLKFIRHVSSIILRRDESMTRLNVKLAILSLRCQSLLSMKLYTMNRREAAELQRSLGEYFKTINKQAPTQQSTSVGNPGVAGGNTPSTVAISSTAATGSWVAERRGIVNNSPSSISPTPSPAGSVGSEGSQSSSGYSTESTTVPADKFLSLHRHFLLVSFHSSALNYWNDADNYVYQYNVKDFFIELDRVLGPLTLHSTPRELVYYVQMALDKLKDQL